MGLDQSFKLAKEGINDLYEYGFDHPTWNDEEICYFRKNYELDEFMCEKMTDKDDSWCIGRVSVELLSEASDSLFIKQEDRDRIKSFLSSWDGVGEIYYSWG